MGMSLEKRRVLRNKIRPLLSNCPAIEMLVAFMVVLVTSGQNENLWRSEKVRGIIEEGRKKRKENGHKDES